MMTGKKQTSLSGYHRDGFMSMDLPAMAPTYFHGSSKLFWKSAVREPSREALGSHATG
ncbi:MAG TPA: hypothetical protein VF182_20790 [Candidatus Binatia bacterium]